MSYYEAPLAQVHHIGFGQVAQNAAEALLELPELRTPQKIVDLGCGTGITAKLFSEAGHQVTGIDCSKDMLEIARANAPLAKFVEGSVFDLPALKRLLRGADVVLAIGEVFNYLFDEKSGPERLPEILGIISDKLPPQGIFVMDLLHVGTLIGQNSQARIIENDNWSMLSKSVEDKERRLLTREITLFTREGDLYRRSYEVHRQCLYEQDEVRAMLEELGFEVLVTANYYDLELRDGHLAYYCQKE